MFLIIALAVVVVLAVGAAAGVWWVRGRLLLPGDQQRLGVLASEIYAQAQMDAMTRATAQAMRDAAR